MRQLLMLISIACTTALIHATATYGPVTIKHDDKQRHIYLHEYETWYGTEYYISDTINTEMRQAVSVLTEDSDITPKHVYKAWYDYNDTLVYVTKDNMLSAIYPVYHRCGLSAQTLKADSSDIHLGTYPNPNYRMEPSSFMIAGPGAPHCYVYASHKAQTSNAVPAVSRLVPQQQ